MLKFLPIIKEIPLLKDLAEETIESILKKSKVLELKKKSTIYLQNSTDDNIYLLIKGVAKGYAVIENRSIVDLFYVDGTFIANIDSIFMKEPSRLTVECITKCVIISFSKEVLFEELKKDPQLQFKIFQILVAYIRLHQERVNILTSYAVKSKSYSAFIKLYKDYIHLLPHKDVASYLSLSPESFTRIKKEFNKNNDNSKN